MIEGGSRILSSFLHAPSREDGSPLVDSVIVTVAPMFIGEGVGVVPEVCGFQHRTGRLPLGPRYAVVLMRLRARIEVCPPSGRYIQRRWARTPWCSARSDDGGL